MFFKVRKKEMNEAIPSQHSNIKLSHRCRRVERRRRRRKNLCETSSVTKEERRGKVITLH